MIPDFEKLSLVYMKLSRKANLAVEKLISGEL